MKRIEISYGDFRWTVTPEQVNWLKEFFGYEPESRVGDKIFLFDQARNYNLGQIPEKYKWYLWIDADDIFRGGDKIAEVVDKADKEGVDVIYFNYIYQADIKDNKIEHVIIEHLRERIIRNDKSHKWVAPIHETLIEQRPTKKRDYQDCDVLHLAAIDERVKSLHRNIKTLEYSIFTTKGEDPRPIYYLAKAYFDLRDKDKDFKAVGLIAAYLWGDHKSGWPEERSQACEYLAEIYRRNGLTDKSIDATYWALKEAESPTAMLNMATTYMVKGEWERSLMWAKLAAAMEGKKTTLVINPKDMQGRLLEILFNAHLNLNHIDEAWAAAVKMVDLFPNDENVIKALQFVESLRQKRDITKSVMHLADYLTRSGEPEKVKTLLVSVPRIALDGNPFLAELHKKNFPPKYWDDREIAVYCGPGFTNWSAKSLTNPQGSFVGGSEEAVILMSKELTKLGWSITVYNDPGDDEGIQDGVNYLPYYKFNADDHFNILISWRQPGLFDTPLHYKKGYVWAHDILNPLEFSKERIEKIDKVIVQSPWHRSNIPEVPDNKVLVSSNGI